MCSKRRRPETWRVRVAGASIAVSLAAVLMTTPVLSQEETEWHRRAKAAVEKVINDPVAERIRLITHPTGKGGDVRALIAEPDGKGLIVKVVVHWTGGIIGTDYTTVVRWRFNDSGHIGSGIEADTALGIVSDRKRTVLDDYFRTTLFPEVKRLMQAEVPSVRGDDVEGAWAALQRDAKTLLAKPIRAATAEECGSMMARCSDLQGAMLKWLQVCESRAEKIAASMNALKDRLADGRSPEETKRVKDALTQLEEESAMLRGSAGKTRERMTELARLKEKIEAYKKDVEVLPQR